MTFAKVLTAALTLTEAERVELVDRVLETIPHADDDNEMLADIEAGGAEKEDADLATALVKDSERTLERY